MEVKALQQILSQFRQMQENLQKQVEELHVEASAGGGMVIVKMNGQKQVTELKIEPEIFAGKDVAEFTAPRQFLIAGDNRLVIQVDNPQPVMGDPQNDPRVLGFSFLKAEFDPVQ